MGKNTYMSYEMNEVKYIQVYWASYSELQMALWWTIWYVIVNYGDIEHERIPILNKTS